MRCAYITYPDCMRHEAGEGPPQGSGRDFAVRDRLLFEAGLAPPWAARGERQCVPPSGTNRMHRGFITDRPSCTGRSWRPRADRAQGAVSGVGHPSAAA
jgi:hypothetical protein